ncbi:MAG: glycosyltransferase [Micrococcales bacterium]|nr:glycosyltransferase [Micrococcales bacterium]
MSQTVVVTPWYPTAAKPYLGTFVRQWVRASSGAPDQTAIIHLDNVPPGKASPAESTMSDEGVVWHLPVEVAPIAPRALVAKAGADALTPQMIELIRQADVVVAHVTMPTGWAVAQVVNPDQRFILAEHASYLPRLLADSATRGMVQATVARANAVLCAGEATAAMLRIAAAQHRSKIWAVGNPVDVSAWPYVVHEKAVGPLDGKLAAGMDHWLYVGNLLAAKGVLRLARAFGLYAKKHSEAKLTVVGAGVDQDRMKAQLRRMKALPRAEFLGPQNAAGVASAMARADVLVHLSAGETFGLAPIEAVISGLPAVVSRTQGATQTLDFATDSGRVALVDLSRRRSLEKSVVQAVGQLANPGLDVAAQPNGDLQASDQDPPSKAQALRSELTRRYGHQQFGQRFGRVTRGLDPYPEPQGVPLVVAALMAKEADHLAPAIAEALWANQPVVFITAEPGLGIRQDPRVELIDLSDTDKLPSWITWLGRAAWAGPGLTLKVAILISRWLSHLPGLVGRIAARGTGRLSAWLTAWNVGHGRRLERFRFGGKRGFSLGQQATKQLISRFANQPEESARSTSVLVGQGESKGFTNGLSLSWPGGVRTQTD